jgi:hypothetical protein
VAQGWIPPRDCARPGVLPVGTDAVELKLGEREHDAQDESPGVGGDVEPVRDRGKRPAGLVDAVDLLDAIDERAAEAVELGYT